MKVDLPVTDIPEEETDARKIEKRRSWKEIAASSSSAEVPSKDDYAIELDLFERGDIDNSLWAKHLVEAKGDENEAKWLYVKDRAVTAPARRAYADRLEQERIAQENAIKNTEEDAAQEMVTEQAERASKPSGIGCLTKLVLVILVCVWAIALYLY